jgi:hypothetical protein
LRKQQAKPDDSPYVVGIASRDQRLERLIADAEKRGATRVAVLSEEELLIIAELLDELNGLTSPTGGASDGWGRLARVMAVRIYDRLGI